MEVGLRVSAAIALVAFVFFLGQLASHWWFGLSGSSWLFLTVAFIELAFVFVSVSIFLYWFIRQSDWQQVQNSFSVGLTWLPMIAARLLTIKFVAVIVISILLIRNRLCDFSTLMKLVIAWTAFVMLLASGLSALLPLPQATFLACSAAIAILTPLARILVMPVMLAYGRHR